jgi:hypothetical protein
MKFRTVGVNECPMYLFETPIVPPSIPNLNAQQHPDVSVVVEGPSVFLVLSPVVRNVCLVFRSVSLGSNEGIEKWIITARPEVITWSINCDFVMH